MATPPVATAHLVPVTTRKATPKVKPVVWSKKKKKAAAEYLPVNRAVEQGNPAYEHFTVLHNLRYYTSSAGKLATFHDALARPLHTGVWPGRRTGRDRPGGGA